MQHLLKGKIAIVTGGNSGIGKAITRKLCSEGASVIVLGKSKGVFHPLEDIKQEFPQAIIQFFETDVSKTQEVEEVINKILQEFKTIDILVNNAGITQDQLLMKMSEEEWDNVIEVNLKSCYNTCRAVIRSMIKAKQGKIVNISSILGLIGNPGQTNYCASKAGMIGFSKALAKEVGSRGITVNCVAPGFIRTGMTATLTEAQQESIMKTIPMNRYGEVQEVADLVLFLVSSQSDYITGAVIPVNGGLGM